MDGDDEQVWRGRVYGAEPGHSGPLSGQSYVELVGGPLDGLLLDVTGWTREEIGTGVALETETDSSGLVGGRCTTRGRGTQVASTGPVTALEPATSKADVA